MANRSEWHFLNLATHQSFEAVNLTGDGARTSVRARGTKHDARLRGRIYHCNRIGSSDSRNILRSGAVHICVANCEFPRRAEQFCEFRELSVFAQTVSANPKRTSFQRARACDTLGMISVANNSSDRNASA